jgi:DNA-binding beta-propeller fold protein YncE
MRKIKTTPMCLLPTVAIVAALYLPGCDDKPTEPRLAKDYPVYFCQPDIDPMLFVYHPVTRQIDSIDIPWKPKEGVTVSADGKRLYLAQRKSVVVVDTDSLSLIAELPYEPDDPIGVSPDGRMIAIADGGLHVLDAADYTVVFQDTTPVIHCVFSADGGKLYCAGKGSNFVYKVDLCDSTYPVSRKEFADGMMIHVVPSIDESKWFLYLQFSTFGFVFEVYDVFTDSVIFTDVLVPGYGHIAITPDGKYAFYTNACRDGTLFPQILGFTVFDIEANEINRVVSDIGFFTDSNWIGPPYWLAVTPDSRWLAMTGGCKIAQTVLYLYDIRREQLAHREAWGGSGHFFTNLTVQSKK